MKKENKWSNMGRRFGKSRIAGLLLLKKMGFPVDIKMKKVKISNIKI